MTRAARKVGIPLSLLRLRLSLMRHERFRNEAAHLWLRTQMYDYSSAAFVREQNKGSMRGDFAPCVLDERCYRVLGSRMNAENAAPFTPRRRVASERETDRDRSLDVLKGIGILAVVFGHVWGGLPAKMVYIFHMPLFFIVSGYLFRPNSRWREALTRYTKRLVVPYLLFLFTLQLDKFYLSYQKAGFQGLLSLFVEALLGGRQLTGRVGVFWFPACLFLTLLAYQALRPFLKGTLGAAVLVVCVTTAYALQRWAPNFWLPWAANLLPMSLVFFHAGALFRLTQWPDLVERKICFFALIVAATYAMGIWWHSWPTISMKGGKFGWPFLTAFASVCSVFVLWQGSRRLVKVPLLGAMLQAVGIASLLIMYLHQAIQMLVRDALPGKVLLLRLALGIALPLLAYLIVIRFRITRTLLLGR